MRKTLGREPGIRRGSLLFALGALATVLITAGTVTLAAATAASPPGSAVVDQSWTSPWSAGASINECCGYIAQTFTAGMTGDLVGVNVSVYGDQPSTLHVAIRSVEGGYPTTTVLAETAIAANTSELSEFIALPDPLPIVAGNQYAIVVNYDGAPPPGAGQAQGLWRATYGSAYSGGSLFAYHDGSFYWERFTDFDAHFQTWVAPPDTSPPSLAITLTPSALWPPNHKHVTVSANIVATDDSGLDPLVEFVSVTSNEPDDAPGDADGITTTDIVQVNDNTFNLRAERSDESSGRIYTITYRATDASGNSTTQSRTVLVPISR